MRSSINLPLTPSLSMEKLKDQKVPWVIMPSFEYTMMNAYYNEHLKFENWQKPSPHNGRHSDHNCRLLQ